MSRSILGVLATVLTLSLCAPAADVEQEAPAAATGHAILLPNAGFENGLHGWTIRTMPGFTENHVIDGIVKHGGNASGRIDNGGYYYSSPFSAGQGARIHARFWARCTAATGAESMLFYSKADKTILTMTKGPSADKDAWTLYEFSGVVPADTAEITLVLQFFGKGQCWYDDVQVSSDRPAESPRVAADPDRDGLIAHYTFDEGQGAVAKDGSDFANHGQMHNAIYVPSPRGHALHFDGKDSYVDCGSNPDLNIHGDMTFEAWVKVALDTPLDNWNDKYLFGDNGGLAVNRNFFVSVKNMRLKLEHGNGTASEDILSEGKVFDGSWQHVAVVCEYPSYYMFLNGQPVAAGEMNFPLTPVAMTPRRIGGWFWEHGYFKGEIDEIRVYNRALSEKTIRKHAGLENTAADVSIQKVVSTVHYPRQEMAIKVSCQHVEADRQSVVVNLRRNGGEKVLSKAQPIKETRPGSGRARVEVVFDTQGLAPAGYEVQALIKDSEGRIVALAPVQAVLYPEKPEWAGSRSGIGDDVLPPYTPIEVDQQKEAVSVRTWGRSYGFASGLFISSIRSQNKDLLTGPMRVFAQADGRALSFPAATPMVQEGPAKTTVTQNSTADAVKVSIKTTVEYDGFVRMDMALNALRAVTVENLMVEIPLDARFARYIVLMSHLGHLGGYTPNGLMTKKQYDLSFQPLIWMGDEEKGLSWFAESSENWSPALASQALQILRSDQEATLRLNLIGQPVKMDVSKPLTYTFGVQATPLKPIRQDSWDYRVHYLCAGPYGHGQDNTLFLRVPDKTLDELAAKGVRTISVDYTWAQAHNYTRTDYETDLVDLVKRCHQRGMKVVLYFAYVISDMIPEYSYLGEDSVVGPRAGMVSRPAQNIYRVCLHSAWQDLLVDGISRAMDRFDIDGVYLDTTSTPYPCINRLHGCGYDQNGTLTPTWPVYAVRDTFKRIYRVVKERKPEGAVEAHVYDTMNTPALAFATSYLTGEQLLPPYWNGDPNTPKGHLPDFMPLDRFRAEMMGYNWGVPAHFLYSIVALGGGARVSYAITLLHGVRCFTFQVNDALDLDASIGKLMNDFGHHEATFLPYWKNADSVTVEPAGCYVSLYRHPNNGVLAIISNLSKDEAEVSVKLNLNQLQLTGPLMAADGITRQPVELKNGNLTARLPAVDWKTVWVKPAK